jgi:Concanavalin A-like lectin/glucanases superfamily
MVPMSDPQHRARYRGAATAGALWAALGCATNPGGSSTGSGGEPGSASSPGHGGAPSTAGSGGFSSSSAGRQAGRTSGSADQAEAGRSNAGSPSGGVAGSSTGGSNTGGSNAGDRGGGGSASCDGTLAYDDLVLCDAPVGFWAMRSGSATEPDLTKQGHDGSYRGGTPVTVKLPNADLAADFDGQKQFLTIPSAAAFSIPTTGELTWEGWLNPALLEFPNNSGGYVDWLGKCAEYGPTCEWEGRMYNTTNSQARCNRLSAYAFNPEANLGSGAFFQTECGTVKARDWYYVVGEYTLHAWPKACTNAAQFPGSIEIWVNGVKWQQASHGDTGCMGQYEVVPKANDSPINVGTMAGDAWFQGGIGKLAIYDHLLTQEQIAKHYRTMTGRAPTGSCADTCSFD